MEPAMTTSPPSAIDISYRLRVVGWTQAALARELGVSAGMVNNVVHNRVTCHRVAEHIATLLQEPMQALWPGRYEYKPRIKRQESETAAIGEGGNTCT
ncbi:helix-turn-helix domain-containing protein [Chitinibacteraceae bacterium HSL-7]